MDRFKDNPLLIRLLWLIVLIPILGLSTQSHQASLVMAQAQRAMGFNSSRAASTYLSVAAQHLPQRMDLWEMAGQQALTAGDPQTAISYLKAAFEPTLLEYQGLSAQGRISLGDAYQQTGDLQSALQAWQEAMELSGSSTSLLSRIWKANLDLNDYPAAIRNLQALVAIKDDDAHLTYQLGLMLATQNPSAALDILDLAASLDTNLKRAADKIRGNLLVAETRSEEIAYHLLNVGAALAYINEWQHAAEAFRQATLHRPDYAEAWAYLGEALQHIPASQDDKILQEGRSTEAYQALQKAQVLDPQSLATQTFIAFYWSRQENYDLALQAITTAIDLDPQNPTLLVEKGAILAASRDLYTAYEAYQQAISLAPNNPAFLRYLAEFSLDYSYYIEEIALTAARQAVILSPQDPENLDLIAQVLIRLGDLASAERFLLQALEINPDYAAAHLHLGAIYLFNDNKFEAMKEFNLARALAPNSQIDLQALRLLETYLP